MSFDNNQNLIKELRKTQFSIKKTAVNLNMGRNTVTDNFKGICFKNLVDNDNDIKKAAQLIAENHSLENIVERKIKRYYENFISNIRDCEGEDIAKEKCKKLFKNIPKNYFQYIEILIEQYFKKS